jgi:hypothetical protein
MPFELRPGQGTLHRTKDKQGNDSRPDYYGELNIDGTMYKLGGWIKISRSGKWLSLSCEVPRTTAALETPRRQPTRDLDALDPDADIPF